MDSLVTAAARALAHGDPLAALQRIALRDDPPALALRGIAMAQLGELTRARELLKKASRTFGPHEAKARARCVVAESEVALAMRELGGSPRRLAAAAATLDTQADKTNALHARLIAARRFLLLGRLAEAADALAALAASDAPPALQATACLVEGEIALRRLRTADAGEALGRARHAALRAGIPALLAEVDEACGALDRPAARHRSGGAERTLGLAEVEALLASGMLVVDACRHDVRCGAVHLPLVRRPVLFALARALAEAWPAEADRGWLIERAFRVRDPDETLRARLRVEIGRLRVLLAPLARVEAGPRGFALRPHAAQQGVAVLLPPIDGDEASLLALLGDGAAWSTSALALAMGDSQRTVQRALAALEAAGRVRAIGRGRAQRWLAPSRAGFTTILLLPSAASLP